MKDFYEFMHSWTLLMFGAVAGSAGFVYKYCCKGTHVREGVVDLPVSPLSPGQQQQRGLQMEASEAVRARIDIPSPFEPSVLSTYDFVFLGIIGLSVSVILFLAIIYFIRTNSKL